MSRVDVDVDEEDAAAAEKLSLPPLENGRGKRDDATRDDDATEGET